MHLSSLLLASFFAYFLLRLFVFSIGRRILDVPNSRSSHCKPTPRGGGSVFVFLAALSSVFSFFISDGTNIDLIPLLAVPLAIVGFLDDLYDLPALLRYFVQLLTSVFIIFSSQLVLQTLFSSLGLVVFLLSFFILVIFVTAVINFTNFMDGIDGLVAGCMALALTSAAIYLSAPLPIWVLIGALLGFLLCNWSPAMVFMGDVGSTFLGAVFSALVLQVSSWPEAIGLLFVATPLLGDACICVSRRLLAGQSVFKAHRLHLFQRLQQAGWSHSRVSILYIFATAALAVAFLSAGPALVITVALIELAFGFWLDHRVAVPFAVASRS